jgi:hypothetical protein
MGFEFSTTNAESAKGASYPVEVFFVNIRFWQVFSLSSPTSNSPLPQTYLPGQTKFSFFSLL